MSDIKREVLQVESFVGTGQGEVLARSYSVYRWSFLPQGWCLPEPAFHLFLFSPSYLASFLPSSTFLSLIELPLTNSIL